MSHPTVALIAGLAFVLALAGCKPQSAEPDAEPDRARLAEVGIVTLRPQAVVITEELPGRVVAWQTAEIRPQVSGIVQRRLFAEGSEVVEGAALYQIDPTPYYAAYDSAVATLQKAEAAVPGAQARFERYQHLVKQNAVSKQDFDDAVAALAQTKAEVATAKAALEAARIILDYTTIKAPIGGRTDRSSLTPGALVTAGQTGLLTTIRTLDPIFVDVIQSSTNLLTRRDAIESGRLKVNGSHVAVKLKLENGAAYPLAGKLEFTEANVSASTGTVTLRAVFPNPRRLLLPGMYVRAVVEEGVAAGTFLVPQRAVSRNTRGEAIVMVLNKGGEAEERVLSVIRSVGNNWLVDAGAREGDRVIVEGTQYVRPGQKAVGAEVVIDQTTGEVLGKLPPPRRAAAPRAER